MKYILSHLMFFIFLISCTKKPESNITIKIDNNVSGNLPGERPMTSWNVSHYINSTPVKVRDLFTEKALLKSMHLRLKSLMIELNWRCLGPSHKTLFLEGPKDAEEFSKLIDNSGLGIHDKEVDVCTYEFNSNFKVQADGLLLLETNLDKKTSTIGWEMVPVSGNTLCMNSPRYLSAEIDSLPHFKGEAVLLVQSSKGMLNERGHIDLANHQYDFFKLGSCE